MSKLSTTSRRARAKLAVILLAMISCVGGAAFAFAQAEQSPDTRPMASSADPRGTTLGLAARALSIRVAPLTRSVEPGVVAEYTIRIRHRHGRKVKLSVLSGLPSGAKATFSPSATRRIRSTLSIETAGAASGGHRLKLMARYGRHRAIAGVNFSIRPAGQPTNFTVSGDLPRPLVPGSQVPLDLTLTNPGSAEITISSLDVSLAGVSAPRGSPSFPCTVDDFSVTQFSGDYGFAIGPSSSSTLSGLGFLPEQLPQVAMLNRPVNQNGCKGASLQFDFAGAGGDR